jgi:hypothetical protein
MQLIILGMHRSGTSVLARLINLMGVYFGPEGIGIGANQENPKGFWERRDVRVLNDLVLQGSGCDWNRVSRFDLDGVPAPVLQEFNKRASRLVLEMDAHRPWMLKEPRLCLLLPLWRRWIEVPISIHLYRNPIEVASSLYRRNGIPMDAGLALWDRYVRSALDASSGMPRIMVSHRQLILQPVAALAQLLRELEKLGVPGLRMPSKREFDAFVRDDLYREREDREDLLAYRNAPQLRLFRTLESGGLPRGRASIDKASAAALAKYESELPPLSVPRGDASTETVESLRRKLELRDQEIKFVRDLAGMHEVNAKQHAERAGGLEREMSLARGHLREALEASRGAEEGFRRQVDELRRSAAAEAALVERLAQRDQDLAESKREIAEFAERMEGSANHIEQLEHAARQADDARQSLEQRCADLQQQILERERSCQDKEQEVRALEVARQKADDARQSLEQRCADLQQQILERERSCQDKEQEVRALEVARQKAESNIDLRHRELAALTRLLLDREEQLDQSTLANRQLTAVHQRSLDETEALRGAIDRMQRSRSWRITAPLRAILGRDNGAMPVHESEEARMLASSGLFDEAWYLQHYPEVAQSQMAPVEHFLRLGAMERKDPGPEFSTMGYLRNNPDVEGAGVNPLVHYIAHGKAEGRRWK